MDDARMICNGGADDIFSDGILEEKAKTFAALQTLYQLMHTAEAQSPTSLDLLEMFLHNAESQLDQLFDKHLVFSMKSESIEFGMLSLIRFLQQLVLDIHLLFFEFIPGANSNSNGLIHYFMVQLQQDVHVKFDVSSDSSTLSMWESSANIQDSLTKVRNWFKIQLRKVTDRASAILSSLASAAQVAQLQQHVYASCTTPALLSSPLLQQPIKQMLSLSRAWIDANQLLLAPATPNAVLLKKLSTKVTEEPGSNTDATMLETNLLLWTRVFRVSFLHQVERLLQKACEEIFQDISGCIQLTLAQSFGVQVLYKPFIPPSSAQSGENLSHLLPLKLVLKPLIETISNEKDSDFSSSTQLSSPMSVQQWQLRLSEKLSSAELCLLAERIRHRLDTQLLTLLDDVITPVQQQEQQQQQHVQATQQPNVALSGAALMEALQSNCCRLLGQLSAFLRQILEQLRVLLLEQTSALTLLGSSVSHKSSALPSGASLFVQSLYQHFLPSSSSHSHSSFSLKPSLLEDKLDDQKSQTGGINKEESQQVIQRMGSMSALFVGRLAWLLRTHEYARFTRSALFVSGSQASGSSGGSSSHSLLSGVRVAEEQCRSAFEISDADGDGVIHLHEAIDALRALCVGDRETELLGMFHAQNPSPSTFSSPVQAGRKGDEEGSTFVATSPADVVANGSFVRHSTQLLPLVTAPSLTELHSLTYEEFLLVCGPALQVPAMELQCLARFHRALDHLIVFAHMMYLATTFTTSFLSQLCQELPPELGQGNSRLTWRMHELKLEQDVSEKIWLPGQASIALMTYLQETCTRWNQDLVSADTLTPLPVAHIYQPVDTSTQTNTSEDEDEESEIPLLSSLSSLLTNSSAQFITTGHSKLPTDNSVSEKISLHKLLLHWSREVQSILLRDVLHVWVTEILAQTRPQQVSLNLPSAPVLDESNISADPTQKAVSGASSNKELRLFGSTGVASFNKAQQQQILEDACMQTLVDVHLLSVFCTRQPHQETHTTDPFVTIDVFDELKEAVEALLDPITLELTDALLSKEVIPRIADRTRLLTLLTASRSLAGTHGKKTSTTGDWTPTQGQQDRQQNEALLAQLFAGGASNTSSGSDSGSSANQLPAVPRLALLPMALPTSTASSTNSVTNTSISSSKVPVPSIGPSTLTPVSTNRPLNLASKSLASGVKWW
jgi:hypothetical protein